MNRKLVKFLTFWIYPEHIRHKCRSKLIETKCDTLLLTFRALLYSKKKYALMELNPFHIECLYSIYGYLKDTKGEPLIFMTRENIKLKIFPKKLKTVCIHPQVIKFLDFLHYFNNMDFIFVGSYLIWSAHKTIENFLPNYIKTGKPVLTFDHAPLWHNPLFSCNKNVHQFVLADFLTNLYQMPTVYPIIFPKTVPEPKKEHTFLSVGVIGDSTRRDIDSYIEYLSTHTNIFSYIISSNIYDEYRPKLKTLQNIKVYEKASFDVLFKTAKKATFLPFLIHENDLGGGYYKTAISGNLNLVLAFKIIPIIDVRLAKLYGFNKACAILYAGKKEFFKAMDRANNMTAKEIQKKTAYLKTLHKKYLIISKNNLCKFLH